MQERRKEIFDRYLPEVANAVANLTKKKPEPILNKLKKILKKSTEGVEHGRSKKETKKSG